MKENLKKVIPFIVDDDNEILISASDLHSFLEVEEDVKDWIKMMENYGFCEGQDYKKILLKKESNGAVENTLDYLMTIDMAKEAAFVQQSEKGLLVRRYFVQVEKEFKKVQVSLGKIFNMSQGKGEVEEVSFSRKKGAKLTRGILATKSEEESLIESGASEVTNEEEIGANEIESSTESGAINQIESGTSQAISQISQSTNQTESQTTTTQTSSKNICHTNFRDTAKILGVRENLLVNWLILNHYCYRDKKGQIKPYAKFMDFFAMKSFTTLDGYCGTQTFISNSGRQTFKNMLSDENVIKNKDELLE